MWIQTGDDMTTIAYNGQSSQYKQTEAEVLDLLRTLGGGSLQSSDDILYGDRMMVREGMSYMDAAKFYHAKAQEEEADAIFEHLFNFRPYDGAHAMHVVAKKYLGGILNLPTGMFGQNPPEWRDVPVGAGETVSVPWGMLEVPLFKKTLLQTDDLYDAERGPLFKLIVKAPRKLRDEVHGLFLMIEDELKVNSIYRGKAFDSRTEPEFLDLSGVDPGKVVYAEGTEVQLDVHVWNPLQIADQYRKLGLPLKRTVLLEGPYGTGKTMGAYVTAQIALANGWTFVMHRTGKDDIKQTLATAQLYQPCVVFCEDVDTFAGVSADVDQVSIVLDTFDGLRGKGTEILCVLTTNHVEKLHKGMLRSGRLDAIIHVGALDQPGVRKLALAVSRIPIGTDVDWDRVWLAMEGYMPSFVKEAIDRAVKYHLRRTGGVITELDTDDLVFAAEGLRPQWDLMNNAEEHKVIDPLSVALVNALRGESLVTHSDVYSPALEATNDALEQAEIPRMTQRRIAKMLDNTSFSGSFTDSETGEEVSIEGGFST